MVVPPAATGTVTGVVVSPAAEKAVEEVYITGSRIRRVDLVTPAPVTLLTRKDLDASGLVSVGDILQNLPSQTNGINVQTNNGGDGSTRIDLRGLGDNRTLVLVNGRRFVPGGTGANNSVDLNVIPAEIIDRIEVLKDGASAVYGSDAISGVVNIITRKNINGVEAYSYIGGTKAGGLTYDLGVTGGQTSDKGSFFLSFTYFKQAEVLAGQREFSKNDLAFDFDGYKEAIEMGTLDTPDDNGKKGEAKFESTEGSSAIPEGRIGKNPARRGNAAWDRLIAANPMAGSFINDPVDGWRPFRSTGNRDVGEGDFYNYQPENYLLTPGHRLSFWGQGNYEFSSRANAYFEASFTNRVSQQLLAPEPLFTITEGIVVSADNIYNPFGRDFFDVRKRLVEAGNRIFDQNLITYRVVVGLDGSFADDGWLSTWRWDANLLYGKTEGTEINRGNLVRSRLQAAIGPSFFDANGVPTCGTPTDPIADCVPLNLFGGVGSITPDMLKRLSYTGVARGFSDQAVLSLGLEGELFQLWDRAVSLAVGYQFRAEDGQFTPNPLVASGDSTGNKTEPTGGGYEEHAAYGELNIPLLADLPAVKVLEATAAFRIFNFNTTGTDAMYKFGGRWQIIDALAIRGTASRAFRNPNILELYQGQSDDFPDVSDPCDTSAGPRASDIINRNCTADGIPADFEDDQTQHLSRVGGNPNLKPESARIFTAGIVITPKGHKLLDGLSLTVDYFNIDINDSIQQKDAAVIVNNCYGSDTRSDCDLIQRDPATGLITRIIDLNTNIGGAATSGVDFGLVYAVPLDEQSQIRLNFDAQWLHKYEERNAVRTIQGLGVYDLEAVYPVLKFNTGLTYGLEGLTLGSNVRFIGAIQECAENDCSTKDDGTKNQSRDVPPEVTVDVFASYGFKNPAGETTLSAGINNLFDSTPPKIYAGFLANSDASAYDYIGRWFYVALKHQL